MNWNNRFLKEKTYITCFLKITHRVAGIVAVVSSLFLKRQSLLFLLEDRCRTVKGRENAFPISQSWQGTLVHFSEALGICLPLQWQIYDALGPHPIPIPPQNAPSLAASWGGAGEFVDGASDLLRQKRPPLPLLMLIPAWRRAADPLWPQDPWHVPTVPKGQSSAEQTHQS